VADDGNKQRKPDFRAAVEEIKALAKVRIERLSNLSPAALFAIGVVGTFALTAVVVIVLLSTGDAQAVSHNAPLIAAVIALGGVGTAQMVSIALEDRRAHEAALQNYFEQVGKLLIEQPLRRARPNDNLSTVVRAQTLAVLEDLDPDRKRILLLFLYESRLIDKEKQVVTLVRANLSGANLQGVDLSGANLVGANLQEANLRGANLQRANLRGANLRGANLEQTFLHGTVLRPWFTWGDDDVTFYDVRYLTFAEADEGGPTSERQIEQAYGDETTQLPPHLTPPAHWGVKPNEQLERD
jgi:Pentapeptide repeats (8 copies)